MDHSSAAAASFMATLITVDVIIAIIVIAFMIWFYWRIFTKAGYSGALSLINLVPGVGHLICLIILAFGRWPIEDQLASLAGRGAPPPMPPPPPPGTSVMPTG